MPHDRRRFCCDEDLARIGYDGRAAGQDLASWRRRGPRATTLELIDVVSRAGLDGATILDIGAGVGAVHLTLLERGAGAAVDVDASREYLATARAEAERRGVAKRVDHRYGDVVELDRDLPIVEIVTLDSVICCYPYLPDLLRTAAAHSSRLVAMTFPPDAWWMRAATRVINIVTAALRRPDHWYIHRQARIDGVMAGAGFARSYLGGTRIWRVAAYRRVH